MHLPTRTAFAVVLLATGLGASTSVADASSVDVDRRILTVRGSSANDAITLRVRAKRPGKLEVDLGNNGSADFRIPRSRFDSIRVKARRGNDKVRIDESKRVFTTTTPTTLDGQQGNDRLYGGAGAERLVGGPGKDRIDGNRRRRHRESGRRRRHLRVGSGRRQRRGERPPGRRRADLQRVGRRRAVRRVARRHARPCRPHRRQRDARPRRRRADRRGRTGRRRHAGGRRPRGDRCPRRQRRPGRRGQRAGPGDRHAARPRATRSTPRGAPAARP